MNEKIQQWVALYFEGIPFSIQTSEAQQAIRQGLERELDRLAPELGPQAAFEALVQRFPRLSDMAALAGYDPKETESWRQTDQAKGLPLVKKQLTRQRRRIYAACLLLTLAAAQLPWVLYTAGCPRLCSVQRPVYSPAGGRRGGNAEKIPEYRGPGGRLAL